MEALNVKLRVGFKQVLVIGSFLTFATAYAGQRGEYAPSSTQHSESDGGRGAQLILRSLLTQGAAAEVHGDISTLKQENFQKVFDNETSALDWPPMPRDWVDNFRTHAYTTNTAAGIRGTFAEGLWGSFKTYVEFRYTVKTSFVIIASHQGPGGSERPVIVSGYDHGAYPNPPAAGTEDPMVGMCSFEIAFATEAGENMTLERTLKIPNTGDLAGFISNSTTTGSTRGFSHTHMSPFFQVNPRVSVDQYLETVCNGWFRAKKEKLLVAQASDQILSILWHANPASSCAAPSPENENDPAGDASCLPWHRTLGLEVQNVTVPRCEFQRDGAHRCVLRTKREGVKCPMSYNKAANRFNPERADGWLQTVTSPGYSYPCDAGLTCRMMSKPRWLGPLQLTYGDARCVRQ